MSRPGCLYKRLVEVGHTGFLTNITLSRVTVGKTEMSLLTEDLFDTQTVVHINIPSRTGSPTETTKVGSDPRPPTPGKVVPTGPSKLLQILGPSSSSGAGGRTENTRVRTGVCHVLHEPQVS